MKVRVNPVKADTTFNFHVDFNNLLEWELGLLCYALKPNANYCHKIGMGKPLGLGSVDIEISSLRTINRRKRYLEDDRQQSRYNQHCWVVENCDKPGDVTANSELPPGAVTS